MGKSLRRLLNSMEFDKFNSLPASGEYCHHKVMTFANSMESMDPDQARKNVRPDLDPSCFTL